MLLNIVLGIVTFPIFLLGVAFFALAWFGTVKIQDELITGAKSLFIRSLVAIWGTLLMAVFIAAITL